MKTVVILHQYFNLPSESGSTRTYHLAQILKSKGWRVVIISGILEQGTSKRSGVFTHDGLIIVRRPILFSNNDSFFKRIIGFLRFSFISFFILMRVRSKITFVSSTPLTAAIPVITYKVLTGHKYVLEVRDVWPEIPIALGILKNRLLIKFAQLMEKLAYKEAETIVSLSPGMTSSIIKTCSTVPIVEVPNGVNGQLEIQGPLVEDVIPPDILNFLKLDTPFMCYTGTFGRVNDMLFMLNLMIAYTLVNREIKFLLIGTGKDFEKCKSLVNSAGLKKRIIIIPQVKKDIAFLITEKAIATFCFVRPIKELFNNSANKLPESLALGTPVILNYRGWQSELLNKHKLCFVVDSRDLSLACTELHGIYEQVVSDKTLQACNAIKVRCKNLAAGSFDLNQTFDQVVKKLEKMNNEA